MSLGRLKSAFLMKRVIDVCFSSLILVIAAPVLGSAALAVRLASGKPVLHRAWRVGKEGRLFLLYKFRTMVPDAAWQGPGITTAVDSRVTPVGAVLRAYKLDELPQFFNVLKGDMTIVGPRPEDPRYVARYTPAQQDVLRLKPGITSPASLEFNNEHELLQGGDWEDIYFRQILPRKLRTEIEYASRCSTWTDLGIIARTALSLLPKTND